MLNLIDETTNMIEEFKQSKRGTLRVGASHAPIYSILPSTLKKYMHDYPNIDINLIVDTAPIILNKIKDREIDIGVISEKDSMKRIESETSSRKSTCYRNG